tara:strand:+ start:55 stop:222 length:168 start_codon:yes stop_codon:yes gene_type:complete
MENQTLQTMILNAGLEMELNPSKKSKRYDQLLGEIKQLFNCSEIEAIKLILSNQI